MKRIAEYQRLRLGARRRWERAQRKAEAQRLQGLKETGSKRFLREGILYLMIVNMPSEEDLEKARKDMRESKVER